MTKNIKNNLNKTSLMDKEKVQKFNANMNTRTTSASINNDSSLKNRTKNKQIKNNFARSSNSNANQTDISKNLNKNNSNNGKKGYKLKQQNFSNEKASWVRNDMSSNKPVNYEKKKINEYEVKAGVSNSNSLAASKSEKIVSAVDTIKPLRPKKNFKNTLKQSLLTVIPLVKNLSKLFGVKLKKRVEGAELPINSLKNNFVNLSQKQIVNTSKKRLSSFNLFENYLKKTKSEIKNKNQLFMHPETLYTSFSSVYGNTHLKNVYKAIGENRYNLINKLNIISKRKLKKKLLKQKKFVHFLLPLKKKSKALYNNFYFFRVLNLLRKTQIYFYKKLLKNVKLSLQDYKKISNQQKVSFLAAYKIYKSKKNIDLQRKKYVLVSSLYQFMWPPYVRLRVLKPMSYSLWLYRLLFRKILKKKLLLARSKGLTKKKVPLNRLFKKRPTNQNVWSRQYFISLKFKIFYVVYLYIKKRCNYLKKTKKIVVSSTGDVSFVRLPPKWWRKKGYLYRSRPRGQFVELYNHTLFSLNLYDMYSNVSADTKIIPLRYHPSKLKDWLKMSYLFFLQNYSVLKSKLRLFYFVRRVALRLPLRKSFFYYSVKKIKKLQLKKRKVVETMTQKIKKYLIRKMAQKKARVSYLLAYITKQAEIFQKKPEFKYDPKYRIKKIRALFFGYKKKSRYKRLAYNFFRYQHYKFKKRSKFTVKHYIKVIIVCTLNNIFVTVSLKKGLKKILLKVSGGLLGFKGGSRSTPFSAEMLGKKVGKFLVKKRLPQVILVTKSFVNKKIRCVVKGLVSQGVQLNGFLPYYALAHNGCRKRKPRRV